MNAEHTENKSSSELTRDIKRTQTRLDHKLEAMREDLSFRGLVNMVLDRFAGTTPSDHVSTVQDKLAASKTALKRNPTATGLVGAGGILALVTSLFENFRFEDACSSGYQKGRDGFGKVKDRFSVLGETVSSRTTDMKSRVSDVAGRASDATSRASTTTSDRLSSGGETVSKKADQVANYSKENPLIVGLGLFAAGLAISALAPRTKTEDELVGEKSDEMLKRASDKAAHSVSDGRDKVQEKMADQGLSS